MKRSLEGLKYTPELRTIVTEVLLFEESSSQTESDEATKQLSRQSVGLKPLPFSEAKENLANIEKIPDDGVFPLSSLKSARSLIISSSLSSQDKNSLLRDLESAVSRSSLVFTAPPPADENDEEKKKHLKRMERLRLRAEEYNYMKLTENLNNTIADDVTMKSMSYAASVGLNMIVAPISFGVFMYFFAGSLFGWVTGDDRAGNGQTDIKGVIAGVVSGVLMLFIEMTLFVIRSHEMDASVRKKAKKTHINPFGYEKERAKKTFNG